MFHFGNIVIAGWQAVACVGDDVFYPLLQHAAEGEGDDQEPARQMQQRIADLKSPHIQLTEQQLDELLKLNDMLHAGLLDDSNTKVSKSVDFLQEGDIVENSHRLSPNTILAEAANTRAPNLSSFAPSSDHSALLQTGLDYSDFGRSASGDLLTDHTDYALLDSFHSDLDVYDDCLNSADGQKKIQ